MIPFPFNENRFSFFVADHLLVGQLCTNPKSDRRLLSCLKVTQCSTSEIGHALTDPSYDNRIIASTLKMQVRTVQRLRAQLNVSDDPLNGYSYGLWCGFKWGPHHATSHLQVGLKVNSKVYLDILKSVVIPWCNQVASGRPWVWQQDSAPAHKSRDQGLASEGVVRLGTLLSLAHTSPDLNPLDYFIWSYVENITNMTSHNTKASLIAAICRVFTELPPALVEKACPQFRIRIEAVIEAEGGYIE